MIVSAIASDRPSVKEVNNDELVALTLEVEVSGDSVVLIDDQTPLNHILSELDEDIIVHIAVRRGHNMSAVNNAIIAESERRNRSFMVSVDDENVMPKPEGRPAPYGLRVASRGSMLIEPRLRASEANFVVTNMGHFEAALRVTESLPIPVVVTSNGAANDENRVFAAGDGVFMLMSKDFTGALIRWRWSNSSRNE